MVKSKVNYPTNYDMSQNVGQLQENVGDEDEHVKTDVWRNSQGCN